MKVHLLFTEGYDSSVIDNVKKFLKNKPGLIDYSFSVTKDALEERFNSVAAYRICNNFRAGDPKPFIAVITDKQHEGNWFSHYDGRKNIFISTYQVGDLFDDIADDIYIVTELVSNIIHTLSGLDMENDYPNGDIHGEPQGCVNDFCGDRRQIKIKMRSGMMCKRCFNRALVNMDSQELSDLLAKLSQVRRRMITFNNFDDRKLPDLYIKGSTVCFSGNRTKLLTKPLHRAFYILLLGGRNGKELRSENDTLDPSEGFTLNDIYNNRNVLLSIYEKAKDNKENAVLTIARFFGVNDNIQSLDDFKEEDWENFQIGHHGNLNDIKSKINKTVKGRIRKLSANYEIQLVNGRYKIHLDRGKIHFEQ